MKEKQLQFVGTGPAKNRNQDTTQWEKVIHCFYDRPFFPCSFITDNERKMEYHYKKVHYPQEVIGEY